jgi:prepilin peptidase CpaA
MQNGIHNWLLVAAVVACVIASIVDLRTGQIPNWLTLGLFGAAPVVRGSVALVHHHRWGSALLVSLLSLGSGVAAALVPLFLARRGGLGLGDVKLFAAIGAACGVFVALYAQAYAYVFAMVYALALVARRGALGSTLGNIAGILRKPGEPAAASGDDARAALTELKFAPAILCGMCVVAWVQWKP